MIGTLIGCRIGGLLHIVRGPVVTAAQPAQQAAERRRPVPLHVGPDISPQAQLCVDESESVGNLNAQVGHHEPLTFFHDFVRVRTLVVCEGPHGAEHQPRQRKEEHLKRVESRGRKKRARANTNIREVWWRAQRRRE